MPYIKSEKRSELKDDLLSVFEKLSIEDEGELNYVITQFCREYLDPDKENSEAKPFESVSYEKLNEIIGVLECIKQEFYRRKVAPYEDMKVRKNGDIYHPFIKNTNAS